MKTIPLEYSNETNDIEIIGKQDNIRILGAYSNAYNKQKEIKAIHGHICYQ